MKSVHITHLKEILRPELPQFEINLSIKFNRSDWATYFPHVLPAFIEKKRARRRNTIESDMIRI